jgi:hypothetical protein
MTLVDHGTTGRTPEADADQQGARPWERPWVAPLAVLSFLTVVALVPPYLTLDPSRTPTTVNPVYPWHYPVLLVHIAAGTVALFTVWVPVWPSLRRRHPRVHRVAGRIHAGSVVLAAALVPMLVVTMPTWRASIGTVLHGLLWGTITLAGVHAARHGRLALHRRLMIYSVALTTAIMWGLAARLLVPIVQPDLDMAYLFEIARWFGWVLNLAIAQWWLEAGPRSLRRLRPTPTPTSNRNERTSS